LKLSQPNRVAIVITDLETNSVTHHTSIREAASYLAKSTVSNYLASNNPYKNRFIFNSFPLIYFKGRTR